MLVRPDEKAWGVVGVPGADHVFMELVLYMIEPLSSSDTVMLPCTKIFYTVSTVWARTTCGCGN